MRSNAAEIKTCLQTAITSLGVSISKAEVMCGLSHSTLTKNTDMKISVLMAVLDKFPQISIEWLIMGEGDMYRPQCPTNALQSHEMAQADNYVATDEKAAIRQINALTDKIALLERIIKGKDETIEILKLWQRQGKDVR